MIIDKSIIILLASNIILSIIHISLNYHFLVFKNYLLKNRMVFIKNANLIG
jgi:hypothetical protein